MGVPFVHPGAGGKIPFHVSRFLHVIQLELMYRLTGKEIFQKYSDKWKKYVTKKNILKMYKLKYRALKKMGRL